MRRQALRQVADHRKATAADRLRPRHLRHHAQRALLVQKVVESLEIATEIGTEIGTATVLREVDLLLRLRKEMVNLFWKMNTSENRPKHTAIGSYKTIHSCQTLYGGLTPSIVLLSFVVIISFSGCTEQALYQQIHNMPDRVWVQTFRSMHEVNITDTIAFYDFYLNLRIGNDYPFANMYLFVNTTFPNGKTARDTVECILAEPSGRWLGKGLGDMYDNKILFKPNVRFPVAGKYLFTLEQGMRADRLPEVLDVGISIYPSKRR